MPVSDKKACPSCGIEAEDWSQICSNCEYVWQEANIDPKNKGKKLVILRLSIHTILLIFLPILTFSLFPKNDETGFGELFIITISSPFIIVNSILALFAAKSLAKFSPLRWYHIILIYLHVAFFIIALPVIALLINVILHALFG